MRYVEQQQSTILDHNGAGTVRLGPVPALTRWMIEIVTLDVVPASPMPTAKVWKSAAGSTGGTLLGHTWLGAVNASDLARPIPIGQSEELRIEWADGAPGARATVYITGQLIDSVG